jgi:hypothetical protein
MAVIEIIENRSLSCQPFQNEYSFDALYWYGKFKALKIFLKLGNSLIWPLKLPTPLPKCEKI